jgi:hypothetical protein
MDYKQRFNALMNTFAESDRLQDQLEELIAAPLVCVAVRPLQPDREEDSIVWVNDRITQAEAVVILEKAIASLKPGSATPPARVARDFVKGQNGLKPKDLHP